MKSEDANTRYFIDLDLETMQVLRWDFDQRDKLIKQRPAKPAHHRIFLTKGQYNKLERRNQEISKGI